MDRLGRLRHALEALRQASEESPVGASLKILLPQAWIHLYAHGGLLVKAGGLVPLSSFLGVPRGRDLELLRTRPPEELLLPVTAQVALHLRAARDLVAESPSGRIELIRDDPRVLPWRDLGAGVWLRPQVLDPLFREWEPSLAEWA